MQSDRGDLVLVFKGLTSMLVGGVLAAYRRRCTVRERAFRGRKSGDNFLEEVLFAPDPEEQVGRKNGRNAVLPTRVSERSGCTAVAKGVC